MMPYIHIILPTYMVMAFIGAVLILLYLFTRIDKYQIEFSTFIRMFICCVIGGFAGSKILFILTRIPALISDFSFDNMLKMIATSGIVFYGGLFGVIISLYHYSRKDITLRKNVFAMCVPAIPLFHAFGRVGCFFGGCCYGKAFIKPVVIMGITLKRFPVQLLEAFANIVLFVVLTIIQKKNSNANVLKIYLILYALIRFCDEFLRGDEIRGIYGGLSTAQWISTGIIILYCVKGMWRRVKIE